MKRLLTLSTCLLFATFATNLAIAQSTIVLGHDSWWQLTGRQITMFSTGVANAGETDSGPLFLSVYAQPRNPYNGGAPGRLLARAPVGTVSAGQTIGSLLLTAKARPSGMGLKYTTLALEQRNGRKYEILDYVPYYSTYAFPRGQSGGVGSEDAAIGRGNDVTITGANELSVHGRRATFTLEKVQSRREPDATGLLRLAVYATSAPYPDGTDPAVLATRVLGQLAPGDYYTGLHGTLPLKRVRRGSYYLTLAVEEETDAGFVPVAYVAYPDPHQF